MSENADLLGKREEITAWIEKNNVMFETRSRASYQELLDLKAFSGTYEQYLELSPFENGAKHRPPVSEEDISRLELLSKRGVPGPLRRMWLEYGSIYGGGYGQNFDMTVNDPGTLAKDMETQEKRYLQCLGLGIVHYFSFLWGNEKEYLILENGYGIGSAGELVASHEQLVAVDKSLTCFGAITDQSLEEYFVFHYDLDGTFGGTYWHQDDMFPLKPDVSGFASPEEVILNFLHAYDKQMADPDNPDFYLRTLPDLLKRDL